MNKESIDIFGQYLNDIMMKSRQTGMNNPLGLTHWKQLYNKYERANVRKETIKRLLNYEIE
jgi:hypothetical protein